MNAGPLIFGPSFGGLIDAAIADLDADGRLITSVKHYGAVGDGVADDTVAIQAAINAVAAVGGELVIPHGAYRITGPGLVIDESGTPGQAFADRTRINLRGEGPGNTQLIHTGSGTCLTYLGSGVAAGIDAFVTLSNFAIAGDGNVSSVGLSVQLAAYFELQNMVISGCGIGITFVDALSFLCERMSIFNCREGITGAMDTYSSPNAVTFNACTLSFNTFFAIRLDQCDCFTMTGGSLEVNGSAALAGDGYGIALTNPGSYGSSAATFVGVHFEGQQHIADILIQGASEVARVVNVNAIGCSFVRNSGTTFTTNCIRAESSGAPVKLNVIGCGFRGFNDYVASGARPYISLVGTRFGLTELGNVYGSAVEAPNAAGFIGLAGSVVSPKSNATAWVNFSWSGSAIVISDGQNIGSVTRASAGVYGVIFAVPMGNASYAAFVSCGSAAFCWATSLHAADLTANITNVAGTPVDPPNVYVAVYGGAPF